MGDDDIVELSWKSSQTQRHSSGSDPPAILRGSGSGGAEENAPLPLPPALHHQNLFIHEDKMSSWLHHPLRQDYFCTELVPYTPATHPQSSVSLVPPSPPLPQPSAPYDQIISATSAENFMNFLRLRENILSGGRVEAGPWIPVGSSATTSFTATESTLTPATESRAAVISGVPRTFVVPSRGRQEKAVAIQTVCEIAGTSSSGVDTEPVNIQPATEMAEDMERKEREETIAGVQGTEEARGSTSRKRSRAAEMHNLSEKRRREKINQSMKTLQELIPRSNKSNKAAMLEDVIEYVKWLQSQIKMMSTGHGMTYTGNMQQFMPDMAMGMMGMNRLPPFISFSGTPFPRPAHMTDVGPSYPVPPYPFPNTQASDPSRVHLPTLQPQPVSDLPRFPAYMNPYSQFVGFHQMQQLPPRLQNQTASQLSSGQASSSKEPEDNQPTG